MLGRNFLFFGLLALTACQTGKPDLVVADLFVYPSVVAVGDAINIDSAVANNGESAVLGLDGAPIPVTTELTLNARNASSPATLLTSWNTDRDRELLPGDLVKNVVGVSIPRFITAGQYDVCASVDIIGVADDSAPDNNTRCSQIAVLAEPTIRPDLIISTAKIVTREDQRAKLEIDITNIGAAETTMFKVSAFRRSPRWPLFLEDCSNTNATGQCKDLWFEDTIAPGESKTISGWLRLDTDTRHSPYLWNGDAPDLTPTRHYIDVMVDGCFAKTDATALAVHCRIQETDELNNFFEVKIVE